MHVISLELRPMYVYMLLYTYATIRSASCYALTTSISFAIRELEALEAQRLQVFPTYTIIVSVLSTVAVTGFLIWPGLPKPQSLNQIYVAIQLSNARTASLHLRVHVLSTFYFNIACSRCWLYYICTQEVK